MGDVSERCGFFWGEAFQAANYITDFIFVIVFASNPVIQNADFVLLSYGGLLAIAIAALVFAAAMYIWKYFVFKKYFEDDDSTPSSLAFPCIAMLVCVCVPYGKLKYEKKKGVGEQLLTVLVEDVAMVFVNCVLFASLPGEDIVGPVLLWPFIALVSSGIAVLHTLWVAVMKCSSVHVHCPCCPTGLE